MEFVHNVIDYEGRVVSTWPNRDQAERNADEDEVVESVVIGVWKPRKAYREIVRCYYDGAAVDPVSEIWMIERWKAWDVEMALPRVEHGHYDDTGRSHATITVDAWERHDAMQVTMDVAETLTRPWPQLDERQGPPSPPAHCRMISKRQGAAGWSHTGAAVDVYNTGRRVHSDYEGERHLHLLNLVGENPGTGFSYDLVVAPEPDFEPDFEPDADPWKGVHFDSGDPITVIGTVGTRSVSSSKPYDHWADDMMESARKMADLLERSERLEFAMIVALFMIVGSLCFLLGAWFL